MCARTYRYAHFCRSHLSRSHMCTPSTKAHFVNRIAPCLQVHMCTPRSHAYVSVTGAQTFYRYIVKHHVNWFTSNSSIASSNVHISFTLADPVQTIPPMQFIPAYHFSQIQTLFISSHQFPTHTRRPTVQISTSRYTMKDIASITFEYCIRSVRKVVWET